MLYVVAPSELKGGVERVANFIFGWKVRYGARYSTTSGLFDAEDFLEALSPLGPYFREVSFTRQWMFRGQGQGHPLIPSAFRMGGDKDRLAKLTNRDVSDFEQRLLAERDVLIQFFNIADRRGLILPDDSQELRSKLETLSS
jgi:hypothetical protein